MKAIKLTPKERELFEALKSTAGGVLRQHINQMPCVTDCLTPASIHCKITATA